jgi:hypothetical protein
MDVQAFLGLEGKARIHPCHLYQRGLFQSQNLAQLP